MASFDDVIVSTLPHNLSHWLRMDLPHRIERLLELAYVDDAMIGHEAQPVLRSGMKMLLTSLESRLSWGATDSNRFNERVRPELVALATDLLRTRRGVDPRVQPDQARTILGVPLWKLMTGPLERSPSRAELARMVDVLERI